MSKLDDILSGHRSNTYKKEQIKKLLVEVIGQDRHFTSLDSQAVIDQIRTEVRVADELRQKIEEL